MKSVGLSHILQNIAHASADTQSPYNGKEERMKKRAIALSLSLTILMQTVWVPVSFAADEPNDQASAQSSATPSEQASAAANEPASIYSHSISDEGLELIKSFEGYLPYPIWDYSQYSYGYGSYVDSSTVYEDPDSPTGYSTTLYPDGIPEREAAELLRGMVEDFNIQLNRFLEEYQIVLNQNQFDALSSFTYNLGKYVWTSRDYIFIRMLKSGEYLTNKEEFIESYTSICKAGGQFLQGLYDRRVREVNIFYSEYSLSDPNADLYVVNANKLYIRSEPTAASQSLGWLSSSQIIRVHSYSEDGLWAFTSYCGYFGWVSKAYLISINESAQVTEVGENGIDNQGIAYTFDDLTMTAAVGSSAPSNSSGYSGEYAGEVYLTKYILYKGSVYTLTAISDSAFTDCTTIQKIYIPPSISSIGNNTFKNSSLKEILYDADSIAEGWAKQSEFVATDYRCRSGHQHSNWQVTQSVTDTRTQIEKRTCSLCASAETRQFDHIEIVSYPRRIEYKQSEAIDPTGLELVVVYTDGTRLSVSDFKIVDGSTDQLGSRTVTVQYSIFTASFEIIVSEKLLVGITVTKKPAKLTYVEGSALELDGLEVAANYDNGTTQPITEYSVSGFDRNEIGKQTVTVSYNGLTASFEVTVKKKTLTAFTIASHPNKLEYFCGESFSAQGLSLKLTYDNGTSEQVTSGYRISGFDSSRAGTQKVKITYGGFSHTIQVVVILNYLKSEKYAPKNDIITVTEGQLTAAMLASTFEAGDCVDVVNHNNRLLPADSIIGTGMTVRLTYNEQVLDSARLVVVGDLTGDGKCSIGDFVALGDHFVERTELTELQFAAADVNRDGNVDLLDYVEIYNAANSGITAVPLSLRIN